MGTAGRHQDRRAGGDDVSADYTPVGMRLPDTQTMRDAYALYLTDGGADAPAAAAEFDRWLAAHDAEVAVSTLREAATEMDQFAAETYSPDIFKRPTTEHYAAMNKVLLESFGHMLDGVGADCMDHAIRVQADRLRVSADDLVRPAF